MSEPSSGWGSSAVSFAFKVLAAAVMLCVAARLIVAILPVLVGVGTVGLVGFAAWSLYRFWQSKW